MKPNLTTMLAFIIMSVVLLMGCSSAFGDKETNETFSQLRANGVRDYLPAKKILTDDRIQAIGFGFERPLAYNKTHKGRALNRRVDVIIKPNVLTSE